MTDILLIITGLLVLIAIILLIRILIQAKNPLQMQSLKDSLSVFGSDLNKINVSLRDEFQLNRKESSGIARDNREELGKSLQSQAQNIESRLDRMRETIENKLREIQTGNDNKLEQMRKTVDEKLQETLNTRISESFKQVSEQLEKVYKGLGDMQNLATGVGDLKKVLSNVKTRGILGEIQLEKILEQYLTADQYLKNVRIKAGNREVVEFAIRLPGNDNTDEPVLLPVDSKFPIEDYQRLLEIYENISDYSKEEVTRAEKTFDGSVVKSAKSIQQKYIYPPLTTNFAIMFVPTEGLYAQILTRTGLFEQLQREMNITVVGPSNLAAFLSSLQMGFRTLAVQKQSNEVWKILSAVKTEFASFEKVLVRAQKQITSASGSLEDLVGVRSRAIQKRLKTLQELPEAEAARILASNIKDADNETDTEADDSEPDDEEEITDGNSNNNL